MWLMDLQGDTRIVESARVVVHTLGQLGPRTPMSDNHWSIYLILADNKGSVRVNMRAEFDDPQGILDWEPSLPFTLPYSALNYWDYQLREGISVGWIYRLLISNGRDQYRFSGGGYGCRYWVYTIISDFSAQGCLKSTNAGEDLWPKLLYRYSVSGEIRDLPMVYGEFQ
ncbi:hypothetical protein F5884DRAFT_887183 [Xylogone sp. PMI_703]|nr:hypothetical protein F5884DRAFT_887183 [Xylogone sp. PMI_703]